MIGLFWGIACSVLPNNVFFFSKCAWLTFLLFSWLSYSKRLEILEYLPPLCQVLMDQEFIIGTRTLLEKSTFKYFPSFSMSKLGCQVIFPDYFLIVPYIVIKKKTLKLGFPSLFKHLTIFRYLLFHNYRQSGTTCATMPLLWFSSVVLISRNPIYCVVVFCFLDTSFLIPS